MLLKSSTFEANGLIPVQYAKAGENLSPPLEWEGLPPQTQSLALTIIDLHPVARNFVHWIVTDIRPDVSALIAGASTAHMPAGSKEVKPYTGPHPPAGSHDYEFTLYALKTYALDLSKKVSLDQFMKTVEPQTIATAKLIGKFTKIKAK